MQVDFHADDYETEQIFYNSKDRTKLPMFITHKKGIKLDGNNPTYLYGYGGFNISLTPSFSVSLLIWLEMGGVYAVPNLRDSIYSNFQSYKVHLSPLLACGEGLGGGVLVPTVNGLRGEVKQANTYYEDFFNSLGNFEYVLTNPPFNVDDVNLAQVEKDPRFNAYGIPRNKTKVKKQDEGKQTVPNANYLWINLFATSLKPNAKAALVMANFASDARHNEDSLVPNKSELFNLLDDAISQGLNFCQEKGINLETILESQDTFKNLEQFNQFADILLQKDEWRKAFVVYDNTITSLYEACKPEILKQPRPLVSVFQYLRAVIDAIIERKNNDDLSLKIAVLLDESIVTDDQRVTTQEYGTEYKTIQKGQVWDLSKINFEQLKAEFTQKPYKNIEIADLRSFIEDKLNKMIQQNTTRTDFAQRLQAIVDKYNAGGSSTENYYEALVNFAENLKTEAERHIREGLTEDELEIFDLLKKDKMTAEETQKVKLAAKSLLQRLTTEQPKVLVQDWYKDMQSQRRVKSVVEAILDQNLPDSYDRVLFKFKCDKVFDLIYDHANKGAKWVV